MAASPRVRRATAPRTGTAGVGPPSVRRDKHPAHDRLLSLQQQAGNDAVRTLLAEDPPTRRRGALVELPIPRGEHVIAQQLDRSDLHPRMPNFNDLRAAYTSPTLKIPQQVIKDAVARLLGRMQREKRLKSKDPIPTIVAKIFPGPGLISEKEFNKALDVADRSIIYKTVMDADTTVKKADKAKLKAAMKAARDLISTVEGDAAGLTAVFGGKAAVAKARYAAARSALSAAAADMDKRVSTDYNLDDPEIHLGGWAIAGHMHLLVDIVKVVDPAETKTTLIHEASHQAAGSVIDLGYYATPGFEAMTEDEKVNNAAHYEELPRRALGTSSFAGHTFTPGVKVGGAPMTREDNVHRLASEHMRQAWDAAADAHMWLRAVRKEILRGKRTLFEAERPLIMELSKTADLTIHHQKSAVARVTTLDMTLIESVARAMSIIGGLTQSSGLPSGPYSDVGAAAVMVAEAAAKYGQLLGDPARDKVLIDWFHSHYKSIPVP